MVIILARTGELQNERVTGIFYDQVASVFICQIQHTVVYVRTNEPEKNAFDVWNEYYFLLLILVLTQRSQEKN